MQKTTSTETTQKISENQNQPQSQPEFEPQKPKIWLWVLIGVLLVIILSCFGVWAYKQTFVKTEKTGAQKQEIYVSPEIIIDDRDDGVAKVTDDIGKSACELKDFCNIADDCQLMTRDHGCYNQNYYSKCAEEMEAKGLFFSPAMPLDSNGDYTCGCDNGQCVTIKSANRKTYKDDRYGYQIKYLSSWFDLPNFGAPDTDKYFSNESVTAVMEMSDAGIFLTVRSKESGGFSADEWSVREPEQQGFSVESKKYINVSGVAAVDQIENFNTGIGGEGGFRRIVYLVNSESGRLFTLDFYVLRDKNLLESNEIDEIIKSFTL